MASAPPVRRGVVQGCVSGAVTTILRSHIRVGDERALVHEDGPFRRSPMWHAWLSRRSVRGRLTWRLKLSAPKVEREVL